MLDAACAQLWNGAVVDSNGRHAICCEMLHGDDDVNIRTHRLSDFCRSEMAKRLRDQMRRGERPQECWRCHEKEDSGITSLRQDLNEQYMEFNGDLDFDRRKSLQNLELRFGNACQLSCYMYHPWRSVHVKKFFEKIHNSVSPPNAHICVIDQREFDWVNDDAVWEGIYQDMGDVRRLYVNGGEPLLSKQFDRLLDRLVENGLSRQIDLIVSTNGMLLEEAHVKKWRQFRHAFVTLSVDAIGQKNGFIRHPSDWERLLKTYDLAEATNSEYSNVIFRCWGAVSLLNVLHVDEYLNFFRERYEYLEEPHFQLVQDPVFLSPKILPREFKEEALRRVVQFGADSLAVRMMNQALAFEADVPQLTFGLGYIDAYGKHVGKDPRSIFGEFYDVLGRCEEMRGVVAPILELDDHVR